MSICAILTLVFFALRLYLYSGVMVIVFNAYILSCFPECKLSLKARILFIVLIFSLGMYFISIRPLYPLFLIELIIEGAIFIMFLKNYIGVHLSTGRFSLYYCLLTFYALSIVIHSFYAVMKTKPASLFFIYSKLFELACGIYFTLFTEKGFSFRNHNDHQELVNIS